jgi:pimeloyl-ACP methyl ester carboxylesterase
MSTPLAILAALLSALAVYLPTRSQAFTRVSLDGRSMRMLVAGHGDATVVFESGAGASLEMWGKVQPDVSRFARTVSYDRAGLGLSAKGPLPRDGRRIATELRRALLLAAVPPPYILVGASLGGPYIRIFADLYPDEVAGMVLVDPTTDTTRFDVAEGAASIESWQESLDQSRASRVPGGIPVFLIDAVSPPDIPFATEWVRALRMKNRPEIEADSLEYERWLSTFSGGRLVVTHRSGHNVAIEQPELVVETIRQAVDMVTRR